MSEKKNNENIILTASLTSEEGTNITFKEKSILYNDLDRGNLKENNECSICFNEIKEKAKIFDCMHKFCLDCFNSYTTCPNCRNLPSLYFTKSDSGSISSFRVSDKKNDIVFFCKNAFKR